METTLRAYDRYGNRLGAVPWSTLSRTIVRNAIGALTVTAPKSELDPVLLGDEVYLRVAENGVENPDWYLLDDDGDDDADAGGRARPLSVGASGAAAILEWGTVYSWEFTPDAGLTRLGNAEKSYYAAEVDVRQRKRALMAARKNLVENPGPEAEKAVQDREADLIYARDQRTLAISELEAAREAIAQGGAYVLGLDPTHGFLDVTPGHILKTFIDRAQSRGCFPHLTYSFTATHDSAGQPWPRNYSRTYDVGITVGKVLAGMAEDAWVDWEMTGFSLDLYVPDTALAQDLPGSILRLGKGVTAAPRKRSRKNTRSVLFANGSEGAAVEVSNTGAMERLGRRESYSGHSGITDFGTLAAASEVNLSRQTNASEAVTLEVAASTAPPLPRPGGYIRYDQRRLSATKLEPMRVQSIAWDYSEPRRLSVELANLWVERDIRLERRVDAILNGSSGNERVPQRPPGDDKVAPGQVGGLALVSGAYKDPKTGQVYAQATANWQEVTKDADNTAIDDLLGYTIQWFQPEVHTEAAARLVDAGAGATVASWAGLVTGTPVRARIRAYDRYQNPGAWSAWVETMAGIDETPPDVPTAPLVDNFLGLLRIRWDGKFVGVRPSDLHSIEVHVSPVADFTVDPRPIADGGTLAGTLIAPGAVFQETPYKQLRYAKLVGVDTTGNRSAPSAQASGASGQVVSEDLFDGIINDSRLMGDVAIIRTAHINELNLNHANVSTIAVGKLTAGTMSAQVIMGGAIRTGTRGSESAPTVPVVELNSVGIYRWDAKGVETVRIDKNGSMLTGIYKTADTGRRIEIGAAGYTGQVRFIAPDDREGFVRAYTESGGDEAIQFGLQIPNNTETLWNRINYNSDAWANYRAKNHEFHYLNGGFFGIFSDPGTAGGGRARMQIDNDAVNFWGQSSGVRMGFANSDGEFTLDPAKGLYKVRPAVLNGDTPRIQLVNEAGYGAVIKSYYTPNDGAPLRVEMRNVNDDGWSAVWASAFTVSSDERGKTGIAPVEQSLLAAVRSAKVKKYRRRDQALLPRRMADGSIVREAVEVPDEIGLIAQEAPESVRTTGAASEGTIGIDLYRMASATWGATGELADLVEAQGKEIERLAGLVAALTPKGPT